MSSNSDIDRRDFLRLSALGVGVVSAGTLGCTKADSPFDSAATSGSTRANRAYPKHYFPYHTKPATVIDFGLTPEQEERAAALHKKLVIFDSEPEVDWFDGLFDNMQAGGARGVGGSFTIDAFPWGKMHGLEDDLEITKRDWWIMQNIRENVDFIRAKEDTEGKSMICVTVADIEKATTEGKVSMMLDAQNGFFIGNQLDNIDEAYGYGIRRTQLAYNRGGTLASGCMDPRDGGLKTFGAECIGRMNDIGMLVDVGHSSPLTMSDAIDVSEKPIYCSHAGLRTISPKNPRTHTDEGLRKLVENGGVFGLVGSPSTFGPDLPQYSDVPAFLTCIDYAVNLLGEDSVGFALDQVQAPSMKEFLTSPDWPPEAVASVNVEFWPWSDGFKGMENHSGYPNLTRGMVGMGYSDERIMKIMGKNHMRLIGEIVG
ncbi:MAG: dipeptidase [Gammaproteobacteria bacterium]|nr:dipeptidase [Gammaproteobacteria bacterium]